MLFRVLGLALFFLYGVVSAERCRTGTYGPDCQFPCHCQTNECDPDSGKCPVDCRGTNLGSGCWQNQEYHQREQDVVTKHAGNIIPAHYSELGYDGYTFPCSKTKVRSDNPYWNLWRPKELQIRGITILTETGALDNFSKFRVYVENETRQDAKSGRIPADSEICNDYTGPTPTSTTIKVTCTTPLFGNQIRIQLLNSGVQLVLCEVTHYGACTNQQWGQTCEKKCFCFGKVGCDIATGRCPEKYGCDKGYQNTTTCSTPCAGGTYGYNCKSTCGKCKDNQPCDKVSGDCTNGCAPGWIGSHCDQGCESGFYGDNCTKPCSANCKDLLNCDNVNGACVGGCAQGFQEPKCEQCEQGRYGDKCSNHCSVHCKTSRYCRNNDGKCNGGCQAGWRGRRCMMECRPGFYGDKCNGTCSAGCKYSSRCDHVNGTCSNGCAAGWKGNRCNQTCPDGSFGVNCTGTCSANCARDGHCDRTDGSCKPCKAGWKGAMCNRKCKSGFYGDGCSKECSINCKHPRNCDNVNGTCVGGCAQGFQRPKCKQECGLGSYGVGCRQTCSTNCKDKKKCNTVHGACVDGCAPGWQADNCDMPCQSGSFGVGCHNACSPYCGNENHCHKTDGSCKPCKAGWKGAMCHIACDEGTYGVSCLGKCSVHCRNLSECNKVNGSCHSCSSGWTGNLCDIVSESLESSDGNIGAVAGGVSVAILVVLVLIVLTIVFKRRKRGSRAKSDINSERREVLSTGRNNDVIGEANHTSPAEREDMTVYYNMGAIPRSTDDRDGISHANGLNVPNADSDNVAPPPRLPKHAVRLEDLRTYIMTHAVEKDALSKQFADIPYGPTHAMNVAQTPTNRPKNRYKDMYAYDHSRVILNTLPGIPESDYINACSINGYKGGTAYIAAQGPTDANIVDFWRMIWEKNVQQVVMLTNLFEMGKMKCKQYWGEPEMTSGSLTITTESEEIFAEYTQRQLLVRSATENKSRTVHQFHFTAWPDKSTPDGTSGLIHFLHRVRTGDEQKRQPWLVHCSAGVGRTGAFIALDYLYDQAVSCQYVNVYQCVQDLRQQRINMVQTKAQYSFIHVVMQDALVLPCKPIRSFDYMGYYGQLLEPYKQTQRSKLWMNYKRLQEQEIDLTAALPNGNVNTDSDDTSGQVANLPENAGKNRYAEIVPSNLHRPLISSSASGITNYINAVYIQSYRSCRGYIITQTPLPNTRVDWCRLVQEREIETIVTFDDHGAEKIGRCLPLDGHGTLTITPFKVTFVKGEKAKDYTVKTFKMTSENKADHTITEVRFRKWPTGQVVPTDPDSMYSFLQAVGDLQAKSKNRLVLVQCMNGAERSGIVCVLMNVLEQMKFDDEVAIGQVIRQARQRRQQIVPNFEQFKFCHDVLAVYQQNSSLYANI